jgi:hypothetical protein
MTQGVEAGDFTAGRKGILVLMHEEIFVVSLWLN